MGPLNEALVAVRKAAAVESLPESAQRALEATASMLAEYAADEPERRLEAV